MGILILISGCIYSVATAAIATFITWLVCKIRKKVPKLHYRTVFLRWLIGSFLGYIILIVVWSGGNFSPAGH